MVLIGGQVPLSDIAIGLRTFLRDGKLFQSIEDIRRTMPAVQIIVADDGDMSEEKDSLYAEIMREGHKVILCPFDSGLGFKSNQITRVLERPLVCFSCDDFNHGEACAAVGVEKMLAVLEKYPYIGVAGGRVNERPYEFHLIEAAPGEFKEDPCGFNNSDPHDCRPCDLTVNYFLARKAVFNTLRWDEDVSIGGGEHGGAFIDLLRAHINVAWVPGVNINTQEGFDSVEYTSYRQRAQNPNRPCFVKRGIRKYTLGNGVVDYEEK